jgi:xylulokinase
VPLFVGCDLGTMGTKAAVVDEDGNLRGAAFEEVELRYPRPGWVEQSLEDIEASAHRTISAALGRSGDARRVRGLAFSGQMSGIGTIDDHFDPATHFDSWLDTRCTPYIVEMAEHAERVTALSGCPPTYSHGPKIMWWQRERPKDFERIARFVVPGAFVAGRLCGLGVGDAFIDRTYLHFSNLSDTARNRWSDELLELFAVDGSVLPRIVDPLDVVGEVTRDGERATGVPAGTPVAAGAGDQTAASLGAGVVDPGQAFDSAGTASVFAMCTDDFSPDLSGRALMATHSVIEGRFIALAFINGGGLALRWFRDEVASVLAGDPEAYAKLDELAARVEPGSGGLLWCPHIQGRVLPPQPWARGGWVGLAAGHTHGHMWRAILEGIAYEYAEWARLAAHASGGIDLTEARVLGGGARSTLWNSIKADVLGISWVPTVREECGVLGDTLIAAAATGHVAREDIAATAKRWQQTARPVRSDPGRHDRYRSYLQAYRALADSMEVVFEALGEAAR